VDESPAGRGKRGGRGHVRRVPARTRSLFPHAGRVAARGARWGCGGVLRALPALVLGEGEQAKMLFTSTPVSLRRRLARRGRMMRLLPWGIFATVIFGIAALLFWLQVALEGIAFDSGDQVDQALLTGAIVLTLLGLVMAFVALCAASRGPSGVSADSAGISCVDAAQAGRAAPLTRGQAVRSQLVWRRQRQGSAIHARLSDRWRFDWLASVFSAAARRGMELYAARHERRRRRNGGAR
jgi:hypothetical protein